MSPNLLSGGERRFAALVVLGTAQAAAYVALATWGGYQDRPMAAIGLALLAFALYLATVQLARGVEGRAALPLILALGFVFRGALLPEPPFLSDDYFRYLWDGLVQLRGLNPYRYAPADAAVVGFAGIDEALRAQVNHPSVPTIYPPLAQLVFRAAAYAGGGWIALKILWLACDVGIATLLYRIVPRDRRAQALVTYWWSPLVVIEVAWNAHLDLLGVLPLVAAIWLARDAPRRSLSIGLLLACATSVKYFPAALLPAAARRGRTLPIISAFAVLTALLYAPFASAGSNLFAGLATYADVWRFNDGLFRLLAWLTVYPTVAKAIAGLVLVLVITTSVHNEWTLERTAFWVTGAVLILTPTVHPWYLLWMVPLLAIRRNRAWLYLTGSVFLAYYGLGAYRATGVWPEPLWLKLVIYGPFFAMLIIDAWRGSWLQAAWEVESGGISTSEPTATAANPERKRSRNGTDG